MHPVVEQYLQSLNTQDIPAERQAILKPLADYVTSKIQSGEVVRLTFICTHNSRRSHLGQLWAAAAAHYCGVGPVECYSGGTETTACNPRTIAAMERAGIRVVSGTEGENPVYLLHYAEGIEPLIAFSKVYDQAPNPQSGFAAVMTCSHAEENCPFIPGAEKRFSITYEDPKAFDDTPRETAAYDERCRQIATEMLWVFQQVQLP
jgi:arsenate reductase